MEKLDKFYELVDRMKSMGIDSSDYEKQLRAKEEEILENEMADIIREHIEPLFRKINRELLYVVAFHPEKGLRVNASRKKEEVERKAEPQQPKPSLKEQRKCMSEQGVVPPFWRGEHRLASSEVVFEITTKTGIHAKAIYLENGGMKMLKGSCISGDVVPSFQHGDLRREVLRKCDEMSDGSYRLREDFCFSSPSTASKIVYGNSSDGWICWKTRDGRRLKDIVKR